MPTTNSPTQYNDDFFADSRMSFGDHLEELRWRMWAAIKGLGICLILGFVLDGIGHQLNIPWLGFGKPALGFIVAPVEDQVRQVYIERNQKAREKMQKALTELNSNLAKPVDLHVRIPTQVFLDTFEGLKLKNESITEIPCVIQAFPGELHVLANEGEYTLQTRQYLTSLSVTEPFMVYFKVSLLCGVIVSCPWIFYQFWAFVGAGLYPHEKRYVHLFLPFSVGLFLTGILVCQFLVLPGAVKALLGFNDWIGTDPDLRLNEWLGFAIILPLVFGISFQTPLVMMFFTWIGLFQWQDYWSKWRYAIMIIAIFAALVTPTPDAVTMLYLFVPMFGLYLLGIGICAIMPKRQPHPEDDLQDIGV